MLHSYPLDVFKNIKDNLLGSRKRYQYNRYRDSFWMDNEFKIRDEDTSSNRPQRENLHDLVEKPESGETTGNSRKGKYLEKINTLITLQHASGD
ncbi:hypothetical protein OnM2_079018 [Erysiphe neolycopersici]|uniref:Uncharacterized protein n=1 Tax=Erysiphe neolycopersici TaxID=212602 RepID=A0A420HH32_9PEZI|nr:hypothetical protein OnM2_079018 [Erysiphe neolycopersici]